ncbi:reverse transcriptase-like protein [Falsibacillus albus]|uniref:Reverse transcriptase-like protein n=1 Tax=Falsibacillus albus TaxID=2478915 RepID=A0A3L7JWR0_9BACI|nr:reverse transcriptase-like protein [Falsibacillus albus]RLQ95163.1 reverse transcriptase-like protein [Falsibacillus albus]
MNAKIIWLYKGPVTIELESEFIPFEKIEVLLKDINRTGRVKDITIEDEMGNKWNQKEFSKLQSKVEEEAHNVVVYFDGGYNKDERIAGVGVVIYYEKGNDSWRIRMNERLEQLESNNEAEYAALYTSLSVLQELDVAKIPCTFRGDSHVVLNQLSGEWPCFDDQLNKWLDRIEEKIKELGIKFIAEPIHRNENKEADKLASQAIENISVYSHAQINQSDE